MVELGCTDSEGSVVQVPSDGFFFFFTDYIHQNRFQEPQWKSRGPMPFCFNLNR